MYVLSLSTIVGGVLNACITIFAAVLGLNIIWLKFLVIFAVLVRSILLSLYFKRRYEHINLAAIPDYSSQNKRWDALYMQILWNLQSGAPLIIVTVFKNFVWVSIYSVYHLVIYGIDNLASIFMTGLQAGFGEIVVSGDEESLKRTYNQFTYIFYSAMTVIYSTTFAMFMPFIELYTKGIEDSGLYLLPALALIFCINGLLFRINTPQNMIVMAAGQYKETRIQTTIQALVLVLGGVLFTGIFEWGVYGVVIASILSNLYRSIDLILYVDKRVVRGSIRETLTSVVVCFAIVATIFVAYPYISLSEATILAWVLNAAVVTCIAMLLVLGVSLIFRRSEFFGAVKRVKSIFSK